MPNEWTDDSIADEGSFPDSAATEVEEFAKKSTGENFDQELSDLLNLLGVILSGDSNNPQLMNTGEVKDVVQSKADLPNADDHKLGTRIYVKDEGKSFEVTE